MPKKIAPDVAKAVMLKGGWKPLQPYKSSSSPWKSKCLKCGLIATPTFANVQRGSGCIVCKNLAKIDPKRISKNTAVQIMAEAGMKPLEPYINSKHPWKAKCLVCKKITSPMLANIIQGHAGCAFCTGHKVDPKDAVKAMKKAKLEPLEPYTGYANPWKCKCLKCGQIVKPAYAGIKRGQGGCIKCGIKVGSEKQKLKEKDVLAIMLKADLKPLESYKKSEIPWKCRCLVCGKIVYPSFSNINSGNKGCLYCIGKKVDEKDAIKLMQLNGFKPLEPYVDSKKKWKSLHLKCGNVVYPQYNTIQNRGKGCSSCAEWGINYMAPAYLYLMQHSDFQSIKVGISNDDTRPNRIKVHERAGWELYKIFNFENGRIAEDIEAETLTWLRETKGLGIHLSKNLMKQGGYSETVDSRTITLVQIEMQIRKIIKKI